MKNKTSLIEELKKYLNTTPKEQIIKDWEQTKEFEVGPTVEEFLELTQTQNNNLKTKK